MTIGFFDISLQLLPLLKKTAKNFPLHDYVFYGDTLNASSYKDQQNNEVKAYIAQGIGYLMDKNCTVLVIGDSIPIVYFQNDKSSKESSITLLAPDDLQAFLEHENNVQGDNVGTRQIYLTLHSAKTDLEIERLLGGSFLPH
jgi:hypothetical protein